MDNVDGPFVVIVRQGWRRPRNSQIGPKATKESPRNIQKSKVDLQSMTLPA
ncbi:hypothetical protein CsSME_00007778 [Camellia sinensis var. sinensis]